MRICYLANAASLHTYRWLEYFIRKGHSVYLITLVSSSPHTDFDGASNNRDPAFGGSKIELLKKQYSNLGVHFYPLDVARVTNIPMALLQTRRYVRQIRPDILHSHYITTNGISGALSGFHPFVLTPWGSDVLVDTKGWKKWFITQVVRRADCITCDGENVKEALIELGADPSKITRILWAVDLEKFSPRQRSDKLRQELGVLDTPAVISSKYLEPIYDVESLIRSVPLVLQEVPEARFIIAGKGFQEVELRGLAESLGVSDSIRFVGWIPSDEFPRYLASADIYVCTSLSAVPCQAVLRSLYQGLPRYPCRFYQLLESGLDS